MSIEKYLNEIKVPSKHPGPFSVKLKYDIKRKLILRSRRQHNYYTLVSSLSVLVFLFAAFLLYRPDYATSIHNSLIVKSVNTDPAQPEEETLLAEKMQKELPLSEDGLLLGAHSSSFRTVSSSAVRQVSTSPQSSDTSSYQIVELSQLEEGTPYVIRKVKDSNNRYIYFVNEVASEKSFRLSY